MDAKHTMGKQHYGHLALMTALSFVAMYVLMYAMVASTRDVFMNINQVYMAALMTAILMCRRASISDSEIQQLCKAILTSQQQEIDLMVRLLNR